MLYLTRLQSLINEVLHTLNKHARSLLSNDCNDCICREAFFHDAIKSDNGYFMASCSGCGEWYHEKCINLQVKVFEMRSTTCNGNSLFAENKVYQLYNLYNENKGLICE